MRRLLALATAGALVWRFLSRRFHTMTPRVVVGYEDGSTATLEPGSPERELLVDAANEALRT
jgi:hypothetical protein